MPLAHSVSSRSIFQLGKKLSKLEIARFQLGKKYIQVGKLYFLIWKTQLLI
jgi:hypothetical protein